MMSLGDLIKNELEIVEQLARFLNRIQRPPSRQQE